MKEIIFALTVLLISCSNNNNSAGSKHEREKVDMVISESRSYKYDLEHEIYTVFFLSKPATEVTFKLSAEEKEEILNRFYTLKLDKIQDTEQLEDKCAIMPKLYDTLAVKKQASLKNIIIDLSCDDFVSSEAKRVKDFMMYVKCIIDAKPEIKNAPKSDILYL